MRLELPDGSESTRLETRDVPLDNLELKNGVWVCRRYLAGRSFRDSALTALYTVVPRERKQFRLDFRNRRQSLWEIARR